MHISMVIIIYLRMTKRKNNTNNKEEGCLFMVITIFLRMTKRKNKTNNKEEGCAKEDLQLSRFSNFSFTFHQPRFLSSFLLLFLVLVSSLLLLVLPVFFQ